MARKVPQLQIEQRIEEVFIMLVNGATNAEVVRFCAEKWNLAERQTENYIARARKRFHDLAAFDRPEQIGTAIARYQDLYKRNLRVQDYKAAASVQEKLCKLLGLEAPTVTKAEHTGPVVIEYYNDWRAVDRPPRSAHEPLEGDPGALPPRDPDRAE